jgi:hypothetical protein
MTSTKHDTDPMPAPAAPRDRTGARDEATEPGGPPDLAVDDASLREDILRNLSGTPRVFSPTPEQKASSDGAAFAAYQASHAVAKAHAGAATVEDDPAVVVNVTRPPDHASLASLVERARATPGDAERNATTQPKAIAAHHAPEVFAAPPARGLRASFFNATLALVVLTGLAAAWLVTSRSKHPAPAPAGPALTASSPRSPTAPASAALMSPSAAPDEPSSTPSSARSVAPRLIAPIPARRASETPSAAVGHPEASPPPAASARPKPAEYDLLVP